MYVKQAQQKESESFNIKLHSKLITIQYDKTAAKLSFISGVMETTSETWLWYCNPTRI